MKSRTFFYAVCIASLCIFSSSATVYETVDFEPPDARVSGFLYYENGKNYQHENIWNQDNGQKLSLTTAEPRAGIQCLELNMPGNPSASKNAKNFVRREWYFGRYSLNTDNWCGYSVKFASDYKNPSWYGTILNQIRNHGSYWGFTAAIYLGTASADGAIPMNYRYMHSNTSSGAWDSGTRKTGFSFQRGKWYDIVINFKISPSGGGYYRVWVDGSQKINVSGKLGNNASGGAIRIGIYGRVERGRRHIFLDEFRHGTSRNEVDPKYMSNPPSPMITTNSPLPRAAAGQNYSLSLTAIGGTKPYSWTASNLPAALSISKDGKLSGMVSASEGNHTFSVQVTDAEGKKADKSLTVSVYDGTFSPVDFYGNAGNWQPNNPDLWAVAAIDGDKRYGITMKYSNRADAPGAYAVAKDRSFDDFALSLKAKTPEGSEYPDVAAVFGYQNKDNFYYMSFNMDPQYCQLFKLVNGKRTAIANAGKSLVPASGFHSYGVVRKGSTIQILVNNKIELTATDNTFGKGLVGIGSYNDQVWFDDITVSGDGEVSALALRKPDNAGNVHVSIYAGAGGKLIIGGFKGRAGVEVFGLDGALAGRWVHGDGARSLSGHALPRAGIIRITQGNTKRTHRYLISR